MTDILEVLIDRARARSHLHDADTFILRGIWCSEYFLRLGPKETLFHLNYLIAQTVGQGCSYYHPAEEKPGLGDFLIGKNVLEMDAQPRCMRIAGLDAAYATMKGPPTEPFRLEGTNIEKADQRTQIVCNEALSLLRETQPKHGKKRVVAVIGVVGSMLAILRRHPNIVVKASDFEIRIVQNRVHGVEIRYGSESPDLVAEADVAIVTGMTLATNTLDVILKTARENDTSLVMFAETGANFASEYCELGVDVVVSEPFPFYLTGPGRTQIDIYRRATPE